MARPMAIAGWVLAMGLLVACGDGALETEAQGEFEMTIADVFYIEGGVDAVVTGTIESGTVFLNDELLLTGGDLRARVRVVGIERGPQVGLSSATAGQEVGLGISGVSHDRIQPGYQLKGR